jgi:hypothetical protein
MKLYFKIILYLVTITPIYGYFMPTLLSEPSTIDVVFGLILLFLFVPVSYIFSKWCTEK